MEQTGICSKSIEVKKYTNFARKSESDLVIRKSLCFYIDFHFTLLISYFIKLL